MKAGSGIRTEGELNPLTLRRCHTIGGRGGPNPRQLQRLAALARVGRQPCGDSKQRQPLSLAAPTA